MAVFSFHPVKTVTMGEGGAITTNNREWAQAMRRFRSHGMNRREDLGPWFYEMQEPGFNYRATDIQCALGLSQIKKLDRFLARRKQLAARYDALLQGMNIVRPLKRVPACDPGLHIYAVRIDFAAAGIDRVTVMNRLRDKGIGTQVHYIPVHSQPYYERRYPGVFLPGAQHYYDQTLSLPLFPAMKDEDVDFVVDALRDILA